MATKMTHIELNTMASASSLNVEGPPDDVEDNEMSSHCDNNCTRWMKTTWDTHPKIIQVLILTIFCFALTISGIILVGFGKAAGAFGMAVFLSVCLIYKALRDRYGDTVYGYTLEPVVLYVKLRWSYVRWICLGVVAAAIIAWLAIDTRKDPRRFISLAGLFTFILFSYLISKHRYEVSWRPVIWGITLQFIFGILILRTSAGFAMFEFFGEQIEHFLLYTDSGSKFVFGDKFTDHYFAFKVIPIVIFFSTFVSILYHLEIMQVLILKVSWLMQMTMGTSGAESLNSAGNIFVGMTESPLMIRPFLERMTVSEIHSVMTSGFATIAGSVLAAYISFGVSASHLLSASLMSAPAALAISKLIYPETKEPETAGTDNIDIPKAQHTNLIEAAAAGASAAIPLAANIAANLISFLALLAFVDGVLAYIGVLIGVPDLTFRLICSYLLRPVAFIMGVEWKDTGVIAQLIGTKTFLNEFVAYADLAEFVKRRKAGGEGVILSVRSEVIATYALCGFANIGSIGIMLGGLGAMAPSRRTDMAKCALRALIGGTVACFMTACVAGTLY